MNVIGLDPGTEKSALVVFNGLSVADHREMSNRELLAFIRDYETKEWRPRQDSDPEPPSSLKVLRSVQTVLVIEQVESFGMAVGREVFETVFWTGRFAEAWCPRQFERLPRRIIKQHLCHTPRATDANIRQALIDRFGPGTEKAIGRKKEPGPLFGITGHKLAALAVALTWFDQHGHEARELRPGVRPEF